MSRFPKGIRHRPYRGRICAAFPTRPERSDQGIGRVKGRILWSPWPYRADRIGTATATLADMEWQMAFEPSRTVTRAFFEHPVNRHTLGNDGYHGKDHWLRALENGRELAAATGANLRVIELFAALHDSERETGATIPTTDTGWPGMRAPCKESGST